MARKPRTPAKETTMEGTEAPTTETPDVTPEVTPKVTLPETQDGPVTTTVDGMVIVTF